MTDFLDGLEQDLVAAAHRRSAAHRRAARPPLRTLALAAALFVLVAGTATGATLFVLRGSPIPEPAPRDLPREQTPAPGTSRVAPVQAADPDRSAPPWTVRLARSRTGLLCSTVGQVLDGDFGLVGLDGRFRALPERVTDGCGIERRNAASLIGARVFDATRRSGVRTVVNGVAGDRLREVVVEGAGQRRRVPVAAGGVFVTVYRGYPEDLGLRVTLRFADGHRESHPFGRSAFVAPDPLGDGAWRIESYSVSGYDRTCARLHSARQGAGLVSTSEGVCGDLGGPRRSRGVYFAARRLRDTGNRTLRGGFARIWRHAPRTAVWGGAGRDVAGIVVSGPGARRAVTIAPNRAFLAVFPPSVDPGSLRITVRFTDGRRETHSGDTNLVGRSR